MLYSQHLYDRNLSSQHLTVESTYSKELGMNQNADSDRNSPIEDSQQQKQEEREFESRANLDVPEDCEYDTCTSLLLTESSDKKEQSAILDDLMQRHNILMSRLKVITKKEKDLLLKAQIKKANSIIDQMIMDPVEDQERLNITPPNCSVSDSISQESSVTSSSTSSSSSSFSLVSTSSHSSYETDSSDPGQQYEESIRSINPSSEKPYHWKEYINV